MAHRKRALGALQEMATDVLRAPGDERVGSVRGRLGRDAPGCAELVCVVDTANTLLGIVPLADLLRAPEGVSCASLMIAPAPAARVDARAEEVATLALRHGLTAVPVIDEGGHLAGVVPARALLETLRHEHLEDLHRLAGIRHESVQARRALVDPPTRRARDRLPWLLVGLGGSLLTAFVVSRFEHILEARIAVAYFIPAIVYLADAVGTQTEAIVVRGLSGTGFRVRAGRLLGGELRTGALIGLVLAAVSGAAATIALGDVRLGAAVAAAILVAGTVATGVGFLLPWALARAGRDPAFGSGPLATIIQDVLSLLTYFAAVELFAAS